jgi:hypothetical protein
VLSSSYFGPKPTRLAVREDRDVVARQRRVQQLRHPAQVQHIRLADVRAQAGVERKVALHGGSRGSGHHHLAVRHGGVARGGTQRREA